MKIKLTIRFKNGSTVKFYKIFDDPPRGTDSETHYRLVADDLIEKIMANGMSLSIFPSQIEKIFIKPKGEDSYVHSEVS